MSTQNNIDPISGNVVGTTKQKSWFRTEVDFENSFKFWFALQWQNKYLPIFMVLFIATIIELCKFGAVKDAVVSNFDEGGVAGGIFTLMGCLIPPVVCMVIAYKGFYQFWNDIKNGTSR